ncbi:uncharacterized protein DUF1566 [Desulfobotulus alkaliphilus]|uniref:Uncharacterized protein DUF1566 n=1 Tax=Desulfobotulus alkaliphilus TaxID=622671 RepID=A0A562RY55_9BACT|nr:DUF1566 domain-containing protein [Desulfobotulus alkaliphilus]TWI73981.1 uncharacterized protein DUF1566 [Desulfobotulus alkaliphilus]
MKKKRVQVKGCFRKNMVVLLGVMMVFCVAGAVQAAQKRERFQEVEGSSGSIVRDNNTGLEWQRCPHGQSWTGSGCSGTPWQGKWDDAVRIKAPGGFRVPSIDELKTLAPYDESIFPGGALFWSSSPDAGRSDGAVWHLHFGYGVVASGSKGYYGQLRLVRAGQ